MTKTLLLAGAAALAFSGTAFAGHAAKPALSVSGHFAKMTISGKGGGTLYDQTSAIASEGINSQNFESTYAAYDDQGADDFVVPKGATWTVTEVDAPGLYFNGYGPASSEDVHFYADANGVPGKEVKCKSCTGVNGGDSSGSFTIPLGKGAKLKGSSKAAKSKGTTYWVSVVANCSFSGGCGEWGWSTSSVLHGNPAQWQNPGGGFGVCPTWGPITSCISGNTEPDFSFTLKGKSKKSK